MRLPRRISIKTTVWAVCFVYSTVATFIIINLQSCVSQTGPDGSQTGGSHLEFHAQHLNAFQRALATLDKSEGLRSILRTEEIDRLRQNLQTLSRANDAIPTIYVITPTYARAVQKAELTRLCNTFLLVPNLHWIVVEDSATRTRLVANALRDCGVAYTHLNAITDSNYKLNASDPSWLKPRGVAQRNEALRWLRTLPGKSEAIVYFADDDNTYSLRLFEEMRTTRQVSVWPVGLSGGLLYETPIVRHGQVVGFYTAWKRERPFPIDMAGFAINLRLIQMHPTAYYSNNVPRGYLESHLLSELGVSSLQLEPRAGNCSEIIVWHTRTEAPKLKNEALVRNFPADQRVFIDLES